MHAAKKEKPAIIVAGTTAYARILNWKKFAAIADEVGALLLADMSHIAGLVATGVYPSPVPHVHVVTTTTHKTLRGPRGALIMVTAKGLKKDPDLGSKIDKAIIPGIQGGPHLNTIAGIGVALKEASSKSFVTYTKQIVKNAAALATDLKKYDFTLVTGGTDSHLLLIDCRNKGLLGNTVAETCEAVNIVLNRNGVPFDPNPPFYPSGIRLGTPGITSRRMKEKEMKVIASCIHEAVQLVAATKQKLKISDQDERNAEIRRTIIAKTTGLSAIRKRILALCAAFPLRKNYSLS